MPPADLQFFSAKAFAVVGASTDPAKFGNKVLKWYVDHGLPATGINPHEPVVHGIKSAPSITSLVERVKPDTISVSVVTPPRVSEALARELRLLGPKLKGVWFQPGSYDNAVLDSFEGINVIARGRCILVEGESALRSAGKL